MPKYGVFSGPYFPLFGLNKERYSVFSANVEKYGPEKSPYLDTFHAVFYTTTSALAPAVVIVHFRSMYASL